MGEDNYWGRTDAMKARGEDKCPECGEQMMAHDDHGRYSCLRCGYRNGYLRAQDDLVETMFPGLMQRLRGKRDKMAATEGKEGEKSSDSE